MHKRSESSPPIVLAAVQLLRKRLLVIATIVLGAAFVVMGSKWPDGQIAHEGIEAVGIALIIICILGRTWCSFYIAGRKDVNLVTVGPYSVCRNPLYFFSIVGAIGVGAQFGMITAAVVVGAIAWFVFLLVVIEEEKTLGIAFGAVYQDYLKQVPRFLPRWSLWRGVPTLEVDPKRITRTFIDACVFLLAIPIAELIEYLQNTGVITVLYRLP